MRCFLLILLSLFLFNGCHNKYPRQPTYLFPGMVWVNDHMWIDATETTNSEWKLYLYWKEYQKIFWYTKDTKKTLYDTSLWKRLNNLDPSLPADYFIHAEYSNYPVIGITYEQAIEFCKWKTDYYNTKYAHSPIYKRTIYRLPTTIEWENIASDKLNIDSYPFGMTTYFNKECGYLFNVKENHDFSNCRGKWGNKSPFYNNTLARADSYWPRNKYPLYNMTGNVSEMVAEKGIAKGGNYLLPADSCKIKMNQHYTKPEMWLGFRCVVEIVD